jgi:tetratricopeptide (TPR) repeat protein
MVAPVPVNVRAVPMYNGEVVLTKNNCNGAVLQELSNALEKNPTSERLHCLVGEALQLNGYGDLASDQFAQANKRDPQYILREFHRRMQPGVHGAAQNLFDFCRRVYPDDAGVLYFAAFKEQVLGDQRRALQMMTAAATRPDAWPGSLAMLAEMEAGLGMYDQAAKHAEQQLKLDPQNMQALSVSVRCQVVRGVPLASMTERLKLSAEKNPNDPFLEHLLARAYVEQGKYKDAIKPALQALVMPYGVSPKRNVQLVTDIYRHIPHDDFARAVDDVNLHIDNTAYRPYFLMKVAEVVKNCGHEGEAHKIIQSVYVLSAGDRNLSAPVAVELGKKAIEYFGDYSLGLKFFMRAEAADRTYEKATASERRLLARSANYPNDIAWRLKAALWGTDKYVPHVKRTPYKATSAEQNSGAVSR